MHYRLTRKQILEVMVNYVYPRPAEKSPEEILKKLGLEKLIGTFDKVYQLVPPDLKVSQSGDKKFVVVTWNIQEGMHIDDVINQLITHDDLKNSDVLVLQEVSRTPNRDIPEKIAKATNMHAVYGVRYLELGSYGYMGELGNMILSRFKIEDSRILRLTSGYDLYKRSQGRKIGERMAIKAKIKINGKEALIYCAHLEPFTSPYYRARQFQDVLNDAAYHEQPVVIAGDFNLFLFEPWLRFNRCDFQDHLRGKYESTMHHPLFRVLGVRLDRIMTKGLEVLETKIIDDVGYSDHRPVREVYGILD